MKLDSIVYDYNTLQNAIANELYTNSPTFKAIYPSDTATSLVDTLASYGAMLQYQIVSAMANMYTDSAYSEAGIHQLAETLGNRLHGNISSQVLCNMTRTNLPGINVVIPRGSKFTASGLNFFNPNPINFVISSNTTKNIKLVQGTLLTVEKTASGISGEKIYFAEDFKCNTNMVTLYIDGVKWDLTNSFLPYVVTDTNVSAQAQVAILRTDPDGRSYIKFGNNTNGIIPGVGAKIKIEYVSNEGEDGNIDTNQAAFSLDTPIYYTSEGRSIRLEVNIVPTSTVSGGFNTQSLDILRESSPYMFASGQRAVRRDDYKTLLLNQCGYKTCNVWGEYEEASISGGYDKIMMNMVYYSGIKSYQKYDLLPLEQLDFDIDAIQDFYDLHYTISTSIKSARGFLGSYVLDITSYTLDDSIVKVRYQDKSGTGLLTCDPSINTSLWAGSPEGTDKFVDEIFPNNDLIETDFTSGNTNEAQIYINQIAYEPDGTTWINPSENYTDLAKYLISKPTSSGGYNYAVDFVSSGKEASIIEPISNDSKNSIITYDNPFQIRLNFIKKTSLAAIAFKSPTTSLNIDKFPYQLAIYGTNEALENEWDPININYINVKNNSNWTKLTSIQTIDVKPNAEQWTDWITTNVYQPGKTQTQSTKIIKVTKANRDDGDITGSTYNFPTDGDIIDDPDYSFVVYYNGVLVDPANYMITDENEDEYKDCIRFLDGTVLNDTDVVRIEAYLYDWFKFSHYLIEIYALQDKSVTNPTQVSFYQLKALYKNSVSTIDYTHENAINLNIPIITEETEAFTIENQDITIDLPTKNYIIDDSDLHDFDIPTDLSWEGDTIDMQQNIEIYNYNVYLKPTGSSDWIECTESTSHADNTYEIKKDDPDNPLKATRIYFYAAPSVGDLKIELGKRGTLYSTIPLTDNTSNTVKAGRCEITKVSKNDVPKEHKVVIQPILSAKPANTFKCTDGNVTLRVNPTNLNHFNEKSLCLPSTMEYYMYNVTINGVTEDNGYRTGDTLIYTYNAFIKKGTIIPYNFIIQVTNIASQQFTINLSINGTENSTNLRGQANITLNGQNFSSNGAHGGTGGTISINSDSSVTLYANYIGNFYSNADIQAADLPIIDQYNHFTTYLEFKQPLIRNVSIGLTVEYENISNYLEVHKDIENAVFSLFDIKPYSIGKTLYISDVWKAVNSVKGVKRFNVVTPISDISCGFNELLQLPAENLRIVDIINTNEYK